VRFQTDLATDNVGISVDVIVLKNAPVKAAPLHRHMLLAGHADDVNGPTVAAWAESAETASITSTKADARNVYTSRWAMEEIAVIPT